MKREISVAVRTRRNRYSGVAEDQANSARTRQEDTPDADNGETSGTDLRNGPTTQRAMDMEQPPIENRPDSEGVAELNAQPTQEETGSRKRLKWTNEMNEYLYRSYLTITEMENTNRPYSDELYRMMTAKFPELTRKTRQNILDQRRQLFTKNRIDANKILEIRREVEIEIGRRQPELQNDVQRIPETNERINLIDERELDCFERNLTLYKGLDPLLRAKLPRLKTNKTTKKTIENVNRILTHKLGDIKNLNDYHDVIYSAALTVLELHGQQVNKIERSNTKTIKQKWEVRIERKINELRKAIGQLTQYIKTDTPTNSLRNKINTILRKHRDQENNNEQEILDKLKQKLAVYSNRLKRYKESHLRKQQNRLFCTSQRQFYRTIANCGQEEIGETPKPEEAMKYWSNIWQNPKSHNQKARWLTEERRSVEKVPMMIYNTISESDVGAAIRSTSNWKAPGPDGIHNYWLKRFHVTHKTLATILTHIIQNPEDMPSFLTTGVTYLLPKSCPSMSDPAKYRPITCLPTLYKILTSILCNQIYQHLDKHKLLPEEQKGCRKGSRGCKEQLVIDSIITEEAKEKKKDMYVAYIDYKKAFDSVPHSLLIEMLKLYKISPPIIDLLQHLMPLWKTNLYIKATKDTIDIGNINIERGIFQGDALSALWYCITLAPLSRILNKNGVGYQLHNKQRVDHLAYMDDIKLISNSKEGLDTLLKTIKKYSEDTKMEFGLDKCRISAMKRGLWMEHPGFSLDSNRVITAMSKQEEYQYLGLDQARGIKHKQIKINVKKKLLDKIKSILKSQLSASNKVKAVNSYAIPTATYTFGIIKWSDTDIQDLNRAVRKEFTKYRARHPKDSVDRFYIPRSKGGRGIIDLKETHQQQIESLRNFFYTKSETSEYHHNIANADKKLTPLNLADKNFRPLNEIVPLDQKMQRWKSKELHGRFPTYLETAQIDGEASIAWLKNSGLFAETEGFIMAIQDQVLPTLNYRKFIIKDPTVTNDKCRLCHEKSETVTHIIAGCTTLAPTEYLRRHDSLGKVIHQELCKNAEMNTENIPNHRYRPDPVSENETHKIYWNRTIYTDHTVESNRPDIVYQDKLNKITYLIDIAVPAAHNILNTQKEKIRKYLPLAAEVKTLWNQDKVAVIPIVVGATGEIPTKIHDYIKELNLPSKIYLTLQKTAILGTCHIARKTLNIKT